ncbi:15030_t:CDS:1 [Funneliformis geosporum]|uniref:Phosphatidylglycerol/phosphatidylinositol transfer protein n=1 Tax=Funneliformis geosporum TaxID=1117311 RepID=A0A9W4WTY8_9GLOM|nr:15030_t:CDS:1 [Funneliformis geosporum]CAI2185709.1 5634_t:CDS:1 [Funneliformis geosporum]
MKRNLTFVFFLLFTLSVIRAFPHQLKKRLTAFGLCPPKDGTTPPLISVELGPDPILPGQQGIFVVTGTLEEDIISSTHLVGYYSNPDNSRSVSDNFTQSFCGGSGCPIKANTQFTSYMRTIAPEILTVPYGIVVYIVDVTNKTIGCATALIQL